MGVVTCVYCGKKVNKDKCYTVLTRDKPLYFCNQEEASKHQSFLDVYNLIFDIIEEPWKTKCAKVKNIVDDYSLMFDDKLTYNYLLEQKDKLIYLMSSKNLSFDNKISYLRKVLDNELPHYVIKEQFIREQDYSDYSEYHKYKPKKKRKSLKEIEKEIGDSIE